MAKQDKMTDDELIGLIDSHITDSLGYGGTISEQREEAMDYYLGNPNGLGNEQPGRSTFVSSDVSDTVEWIMPSLMRVFTSGDEVCTFHPVGPDPLDADLASQATLYVNHVLMKQNPGYTLLHDFMKDAILQKVGFLKIWWDEKETVEREEYKNLTDMELDALISDDNVEVIAHTEIDAEIEDNRIVLHDVTINRTKLEGQVRIEGVPPDEMLIARMTKDIQDSHFVCHRVKKTASELREMGFEIDVQELSSASTDMDTFSAERQSRYSFDNSSNFSVWGGTTSDIGSDESMREFWVHESYIRADYDGTGIAQIRKVLSIGRTILDNEAVDAIPFVSITPIRIPHKFFGLSVADITMPIQEIKSVLMRNLLDNAYSQNYGRFAVVEGQANLDDLLTQRPGGIVRVKSPQAIMPLPTPALEPYSFQMLEYLDHIREARAGVSKTSQGLNENALKSHTTATAVSQVMTAAQSRVELIARNFAHTGVRDLCRTIYSLLVKHQDFETVVNLQGNWIPVNPSMWRDKTDCTVSTGIGFGSKDQQMAYLSQMISFASQSMAGGLRIVNEQNMYEMAKELLKSMGFSNFQDFITNPSQIEPEPNPEAQLMQAEMQMKQEELKLKTGELMLKQQKLQQDAQNDMIDARLKAEELALERDQKRAVAIGAT